MAIVQFPPALAPSTQLLALRGIVVHTTGAGLHATARKHKRDPFDHAVRLYSEHMAEGPHVVIDHDSLRVAQIQFMDRRAYHVGTLKPGQLEATVPHHWWNGVFPDLKRLGRHPLWYAGSVNAVTWGVEVIPPAAHPAGPWTDDAMGLIAETLQDLLEGATQYTYSTPQGSRWLPLKARQPVDRFTVATHSELSPYTRTTERNAPNGVPWDLALPQARQLDEIVRELAR